MKVVRPPARTTAFSLPHRVSRNVQQCPERADKFASMPNRAAGRPVTGCRLFDAGSLDQLFHWATISSAMRLSNSTGVMGMGSTASCVSLARVVGDCSALTAAA